MNALQILIMLIFLVYCSHRQHSQLDVGLGVFVGSRTSCWKHLGYPGLAYLISFFLTVAVAIVSVCIGI